MYTVPQLPFPYNSTAHYEATISVPLGKDWQTAHVHQASVKPAVFPCDVIAVLFY